MKHINEIFYSGYITPELKQIKTIDIDWVTHSNGIINIAKNIIPEYELTENNKNILKLFLLYFTGNEQFETEYKKIYGSEGSLKKGLFLIGGVGTGKSIMFEIFRIYTRDILQTNSFKTFSSIEIIDSINVIGVKYLEIFNDNIVNNEPKPIKCYIDDIACKNEIVGNFGTKINSIERLISIRYLLFQRYGTLTHISSNKYPKELIEIYDIRTVDRLKEMVNILELNGKSFRK